MTLSVRVFFKVRFSKFKVMSRGSSAKQNMTQLNSKSLELSSHLHSSLLSSTVRDWQSTQCTVTAKNIMYPLFIVENDDGYEEINSLPGVYRYGINRLKDHLASVIENGLSSVLIFGVISTLAKDARASNADSKENPVVKAVPLIKKWFPNLTVACDVCMCAYTDSGHCGILNHDGSINNCASIQRLAEISLVYAQAGADIVAPSDMMDGRVGAIKQILIDNGLEHRVAVLSYAAKFASAFYGPFREAAKSAPAFGDRKCYQLPPGSRGLAHRATARDVKEGADMLMVKPALSYLDIVRDTKNQYPDYPLFVYQVSGEYAMIYHAAQQGAYNLEVVLKEILTSMRRAGADVIITYFAPLILQQLKQKGEF